MLPPSTAVPRARARRKRRRIHTHSPPPNTHSVGRVCRSHTEVCRAACSGSTLNLPPAPSPGNLPGPSSPLSQLEADPLLDGGCDGGGVVCRGANGGLRLLDGDGLVMRA
eukprot:scaffold20892_cov112-Isochrysis_galbana.AAC.5